MKRLTIRHATRYDYPQPVVLGPHRLMVRPRDSHDLRLVDATLTLEPAGAPTWVHDVFGNSVAVVDFGGVVTSSLTITSSLVIERYGAPAPQALMAGAAANWPFLYDSDERIDLGRMTDRHYPDDGEVKAFVSSLSDASPVPTLELLDRLVRAIRDRLAYSRRDAEGTRAPREVLALGEGTCRDYALLFMEAARELGFGARFVTGYLHDPALDGSGIRGAAATHAWAEVYLPGAGWLEYDPTNGLVGSEHLVRVAVVRDPKQAAPVSGSFTGVSGTLNVEVDVSEAAAQPTA